MTDKTSQLINLWNGSWIAALFVGLAVWVMVILCIIVYRKRKNDDQLPVQLRYHVPLEMLFVVIPVIMVGTLFFFSARSTAVMVETDGEPEVTIDVYGRQWTWDFVYNGEGPDGDDGQAQDLHLQGDRVELSTEEGVEETLPTLYLPVGETVEFSVHSRDVNHSFWIPAFLYKIDMLPGRVSTFQLTPGEEGVYSGKCAELCGEFHSEMLFNVAVVPRAEFDAMMDEYEQAGQIGPIDEDLNRQYDLPHATDAAGEGDN